MEALWLWKQFPRQIASDLSRFHRRRIAEWHSGQMSSYELLELLEFMPEEGAFRTAVRGGSWSEPELVAAETYNELARLRASYHAVNGGEKSAYEPFTFDDPTLREEKHKEAAELAEFRKSVEDDMFTHLGWSNGEEGD
ncbi:hypothetical protein ABQE69_09020 [Mycolicibacillus trivialis]